MAPRNYLRMSSFYRDFYNYWESWVGYVIYLESDPINFINYDGLLDRRSRFQFENM